MPVSGMKVKQAINEARKWWNKKGREQSRAARDRKVDGIKDDEEIMAKSGILTGAMFDECDTESKNSIVKSWHKAWCEVELGIDEREYVRISMEEMFYENPSGQN